MAIFRSKKLLDAVRHLGCAHCHQYAPSDPAHRNEGKGMGLKVSDALVAPLCRNCHHELDNGNVLSKDERRDMWNRAYINGIQYMIENEILILNPKVKL